MAGVAFAVEGDGVGFATESYAASALYTTLASLSCALSRIRRVRKRSVCCGQISATSPTDDRVRDTMAAPRIIQSVSSLVASNSTKEIIAIPMVAGPVRPSRPRTCGRPIRPFRKAESLGCGGTAKPCLSKPRSSWFISKSKIVERFNRLISCLRG